MTTTAFIALGSNLGDRLSHLNAAVSLLGRTAGVQVEAASQVYETDPVGFTEQPNFLNAVLRVRTSLDPFELLRECQGIERALGRERSTRWGPRTVDLDILLYGDSAVEADGLIIPHPRMEDRAFALRPLADLAPDLHLPSGSTVAAALSRLDQAGVRPHGVTLALPEGAAPRQGSLNHC